MKRGKVRPLAVCVIIEGGNILVQEGYDVVKKELFYRPLGGKIKFREKGSKTIVRELKEEIQADIVDILYLGTIENIFTYNGEDGHEIVRIYSGKISNKDLKNKRTIRGFESDGEPIKAVWLPITKFIGTSLTQNKKSAPPLYPDGLPELIQNL